MLLSTTVISAHITVNEKNPSLYKCYFGFGHIKQNRTEPILFQTCT